jgi:2-iminobutanoate/2-iminopropanoate deaminase
MIDRSLSAFGNFSELVAVHGIGEWIHIAGTVGFDETGKAVVPGGVGPESDAIFDRMAELLVQRGGSLADIVKITVFLTDLAQYGEFSAVRTRRFPCDPPASSAVGVSGLLVGASVEVEATAFIPGPQGFR